jgi:Lipocalin-like domain
LCRRRAIIVKIAASRLLGHQLPHFKREALSCALIIPGTGRDTMNRRCILSISAMTALGLALLPGSTVAQQGTLKQQLVGTWALVSQENTAADGTKQRIANPRGILIFDAGGRYAAVGERGDRPKFKSASQPTTEEVAAATRDYFAANFGTWSVSEPDKTLTQRFEGALIPIPDRFESNPTLPNGNG